MADSAEKMCFEGNLIIVNYKMQSAAPSVGFFYLGFYFDNAQNQLRQPRW